MGFVCSRCGHFYVDHSLGKPDVGPLACEVYGCGCPNFENNIEQELHS